MSAYETYGNATYNEMLVGHGTLAISAGVDKLTKEDTGIKYNSLRNSLMVIGAITGSALLVKLGKEKKLIPSEIEKLN